MERDFNEKEIKAAKILAKISEVYQRCYLKVDSKDPKDDPCKQFESGYDALLKFVDGYAYARLGAAPSFTKIALDSIKKVFEDGKKFEKSYIPTIEDSKEVWAEYKQLAELSYHVKKNKNGGLAINEKNNPLNVDKGVITCLSKEEIENISVFAKERIEEGKTSEAHEILKGIRGVGGKIASFYLRDTFYLTNLKDRKKIEDEHLLQPIDTWVKQVYQIIFNDENPSVEYIQKHIVELCKSAGISSIDFNQGAWLLGSRIAKDFNSLKEAIYNVDELRTMIAREIKDAESYLEALKNVKDVSES